MTYTLSPTLFLENGPAVQVAAAVKANRAARLWRSFNRERRLALIESQLRAA